jgi:hypothetical protein
VIKNIVHTFQNTLPVKCKLEHRNHTFATFSLSKLKGITQEEKQVLNKGLTLELVEVLKIKIKHGLSFMVI